MKHPLSFLGGFLTGALVMYYLDEQSGGRRRALVRDKVVSAGHGVADLAQSKAKHVMNQAKGFVATHRPGSSSANEADTDGSSLH